MNVFAPNLDTVVKIEVDYEKVVGIWAYDQENKQLGASIKQVDFLPVALPPGHQPILDHLSDQDLIVVDDLDELDDVLWKTLKTAPPHSLLTHSRQ
ncbi:hypothetical protein IPJ72_00025 [Candidatus Peregrinibacteria bacterium]|nr:MAG: hypothetical protein IPJ72_00025 [Candidatus Peregrinibacteria bacterium]